MRSKKVFVGSLILGATGVLALATSIASVSLAIKDKNQFKYYVHQLETEYNDLWKALYGDENDKDSVANKIKRAKLSIQDLKNSTKDPEIKRNLDALINSLVDSISPVYNHGIAQLKRFEAFYKDFYKTETDPETGEEFLKFTDKIKSSNVKSYSFGHHLGNPYYNHFSAKESNEFKALLKELRGETFMGVPVPTTNQKLADRIKGSTFGSDISPIINSLVSSYYDTQTLLENINSLSSNINDNEAFMKKLNDTEIKYTSPTNSQNKKFSEALSELKTLYNAFDNEMSKINAPESNNLSKYIAKALSKGFGLSDKATKDAWLAGMKFLDNATKWSPELWKAVYNNINDNVRYSRGLNDSSDKLKISEKTMNWWDTITDGSSAFIKSLKSVSKAVSTKGNLAQSLDNEKVSPNEISSFYTKEILPRFQSATIDNYINKVSEIHAAFSNLKNERNDLVDHFTNLYKHQVNLIKGFKKDVTPILEIYNNTVSKAKSLGFNSTTSIFDASQASNYSIELQGRKVSDWYSQIKTSLSSFESKLNQTNLDKVDKNINTTNFLAILGLDTQVNNEIKGLDIAKMLFEDDAAANNSINARYETFLNSVDSTLKAINKRIPEWENNQAVWGSLNGLYEGKAHSAVQLTKNFLLHGFFDFTDAKEVRDQINEEAAKLNANWITNSLTTSPSSKFNQYGDFSSSNNSIAELLKYANNFMNLALKNTKILDEKHKQYEQLLKKVDNRIAELKNIINPIDYQNEQNDLDVALNNAFYRSLKIYSKVDDYAVTTLEKYSRLFDESQNAIWTHKVAYYNSWKNFYNAASGIGSNPEILSLLKKVNNAYSSADSVLFYLKDFANSILNKAKSKLIDDNANIKGVISAEKAAQNYKNTSDFNILTTSAVNGSVDKFKNALSKLNSIYDYVSNNAHFDLMKQKIKNTVTNNIDENASLNKLTKYEAFELLKNIGLRNDYLDRVKMLTNVKTAVKFNDDPNVINEQADRYGFNRDGNSTTDTLFENFLMLLLIEENTMNKKFAELDKKADDLESDLYQSVITPNYDDLNSLYNNIINASQMIHYFNNVLSPSGTSNEMALKTNNKYFHSVNSGNRRNIYAKPIPFVLSANFGYTNKGISKSLENNLAEGLGITTSYLNGYRIGNNRYSYSKMFAGARNEDWHFSGTNYYSHNVWRDTVSFKEIVDLTKPVLPNASYTLSNFYENVKPIEQYWIKRDPNIELTEDGIEIKGSCWSNSNRKRLVSVVNSRATWCIDHNTLSWERDGIDKEWNIGTKAMRNNWSFHYGSDIVESPDSTEKRWAREIISDNGHLVSEQWNDEYGKYASFSKPHQSSIFFRDFNEDYLDSFLEYNLTENKSYDKFSLSVDEEFSAKFQQYNVQITNPTNVYGKVQVSNPNGYTYLGTIENIPVNTTYSIDIPGLGQKMEFKFDYQMRINGVRDHANFLSKFAHKANALKASRNYSNVTYNFIPYKW